MNKRDTSLALPALGATSGPLWNLAQTQTLRRPYRIGLVPVFSPGWWDGLLKSLSQAPADSLAIVPTQA